jgi:hypothetical protein
MYRGESSRAASRLSSVTRTAPHRHPVRFELDAPRQPLDDGCLADSGFADEHHGIRAFAVTEDLEHPLNLAVAPIDRWKLVLFRQEIQIRAELLEVRRHELRCRFDRHVTGVPVWQLSHLLFDRLKNGMRAHADIAHDHRERVPFLLRQR